MSFDIYGEHLLPGHCEVHPWVHSEYPCPVCCQQSGEDKRLNDQYEKECNEQFDIEMHTRLVEHLLCQDGSSI